MSSQNENVTKATTEATPVGVSNETEIVNVKTETTPINTTSTEVDKKFDEKKLREKMINRTEVLEKVKTLFLMPYTDFMTFTMMSEYFEADYDAIKKTYQRHRDELEEDGVVTKSSNEVLEIIKYKQREKKVEEQSKCMAGQNVPPYNPEENNCMVGQNITLNKDNIKSINSNLKIKKERGTIYLKDENNIIYKLNPSNNVLFPRRAILRMAMLLRENNRVAREIRTQLLNIEEKATVESKVQTINEEMEIANSIASAVISGNPVSILTAYNDYILFKNRHIARLEAYNDNLLQENADVKKENLILAEECLTWTERASANKVVRCLASAIHERPAIVWSTIYDELLYKHHINLKSRSKKPIIANLKEDEYPKFYATVSAIAKKNDLDVMDLLRKAKLEIENS